MDIKSILNSGVSEFTAVLTRNLKPNEAAAVTQVVQGVVALAEAEAVNRGGPMLLGELVGKYPALAAVVDQVPELKALLGGL